MVCNYSFFAYPCDNNNLTTFDWLQNSDANTSTLKPKQATEISWSDCLRIEKNIYFRQHTVYLDILHQPPTICEHTSPASAFHTELVSQKSATSNVKLDRKWRVCLQQNAAKISRPLPFCIFCFYVTCSSSSQPGVRWPGVKDMAQMWGTDNS